MRAARLAGRLLLLAALLASAAGALFGAPAAVVYAANISPDGYARTAFDSGSCTATESSVVKSGGGSVCQFDFTFSTTVHATHWEVTGASQTAPDPWIEIQAVKADNSTISLCSGSNFSGQCASGGGNNAILGCGGGCEIKALRVALSGHTDNKTVSWTSLYLVGTTSTPTPAAGTSTATPTQAGGALGISGNRLINTDFNVAPKQPGYGWTDLGRVLQAPVVLSTEPIERMGGGSCGDNYWVAGAPGLLGGDPGEFYQDFTWQGGQMFINLEALTESFQTRGQVSIISKATGAQDELPHFTNGTFDWLSFKWVTDSKPAGEYTMAINFETVRPNQLGSRPAIAIDNVNVRGGYWGNDCQADSYRGQIPQQQQATSTAAATVTSVGIQDGQNRLKNCGFEQGFSSYGHNGASRLFYTGGATGPTYAYLYTVYDNGSDPVSSDVVGRIWQPFTWPGGQMYVTYWTGPGTRVSTSIRNLFTGSVYPMQSAQFSQSFNGWQKRQYSFPVSDAGQYIIDVRGSHGQVAALDGFTVASGSFSGGACANSNTSGDNNATATAHATSSQIAATTQPAAQQTAHAVQTTQAAAYNDYLTQQYATMTQNAARTQSARLTATAQGTPAPTATRTPIPTVCVIDPLTQLCWVVAPPPVPVTVSADDLTAYHLEMEATQTAQARLINELFAQLTAQAQQTANAPATVNARMTQTQHAANLQATARAAATQTAIQAGIHAQQTADALSAQRTQQAAATQTALARQTELAAAPDPTHEAQATQTAQAFATAAFATTSTAIAQRTADAVIATHAYETQAAVATANQAATAVQLATQQAQQAVATQTAAALQTQLADNPEPTSIVQATTTAQAHATSAAQATTTAQAQATTSAIQTQAVQSTQQTGPGGDLPPVDDRPEPQPGVDCIRPTSPLQIANWIDYEVCRILTWFAWSPTNSDQLLSLEATVGQYQPFGFMQEWIELFGLLRDWGQQLPWCETGFCEDQPLTPLNVAATGLLVGDFDLLPGTPFYSDQCDLMLAPLVGPQIQAGACFCVNVLCALGLLPWAQLLFNITLAFATLMYIQRTWLTAAHN